MRVEANLLEHARERCDLHLAVVTRQRKFIRTGERVEHAHRHRCERIRVVVDLDGVHVCLLLVPVETLDVVLRALVQIDGLFVQEDRRRELVHLADDLGSRLRGVDDDDVVGRDAPQVHLFRRKCLPAPEPAARGARRRAVLLEHAQQLLHVGAAERLTVLEGQLEQPGLQVAREDQQVVGIDEPFLWIGAEEVLGVPNDELVQWRARSHEDADRPGTASGAAYLLPRGRDGSRIADQHRRVQAADVDAQLESIGADDACDIARAQARFNLASMQGKVSRAITANAPVGVEPRCQVLSQVAEHHLDLQPAAAEDDGLNAGADPWRGDASRLEHRAAADAQLAIEQRRVVEDQAALAARRAAAVDQRDVVLLQESLSELARVGDGCGRADKRRMRAIKGANPLQASYDIGDLATEKTAIRVELIDDDELEAREEPTPPCVVRQDARVQHVGVRHHDVAGLSDRGAPAGRGVAVVRVYSQVDGQAALERAELGQLVLGEGLGREQVDGSALGVLEHPLQDREVVAEGFSAGRGRDDRQVPAPPYFGIRLSLVRVESGDPARLESGGELRSEVGGQG